MFFAEWGNRLAIFNLDEWADPLDSDLSKTPTNWLIAILSIAHCHTWLSSKSYVLGACPSYFTFIFFNLFACPVCCAPSATSLSSCWPTIWRVVLQVWLHLCCTGICNSSLYISSLLACQARFSKYGIVYHIFPPSPSPLTCPILFLLIVGKGWG